MLIAPASSKMDMPVKKNAKLTLNEQDTLVHAIDSAMEVQDRNQFNAWIGGPFRDLLPHRDAVCVELDDGARVRSVECIGMGGAAPVQRLATEQHAIALVQAHAASEKFPLILEGDALHSVGGAISADGPQRAFSALIHCTRFLSGAAYFFVLFDIPDETEPRSHYVLKLLSSHLKMALSRVIALPASPGARPQVTDREKEILLLMRQGRTNQEISAALGISPLTLKSHVRKIYRKLDVHSREEAVSRGLGPVMVPLN
ncbi:MAG: hypothetical protein EKK46_10490 [Rhodocyclaceae bacterium]|nr:MAG: hypothetical protein EKK46_10490 [Rhodocyclaceae bacterium]